MLSKVLRFNSGGGRWVCVCVCVGGGGGGLEVTIILPRSAPLVLQFIHMIHFFCLCPQASEPVMNLNISKLVYFSFL